QLAVQPAQLPRRNPVETHHPILPGFTVPGSQVGVMGEQAKQRSRLAQALELVEHDRSSLHFVEAQDAFIDRRNTLLQRRLMLPTGVGAGQEKCNGRIAGVAECGQLSARVDYSRREPLLLRNAKPAAAAFVSRKLNVCSGMSLTSSSSPAFVTRVPSRKR